MAPAKTNGESSKTKGSSTAKQKAEVGSEAKLTSKKLKGDAKGVLLYYTASIYCL